MSITASQVKELREITGAPMMECKQALTEAKGNQEEAIKILRTQGLAAAKRKSTRTTNEGLIISYIHLNDKLGVLLEINCETDFVARTPEFRELGNNIAMQIAASKPRYIKREDIPTEELRAEEDIYREQARASGKPEQVWDKIVKGRMEKYFKEVCLMEQPYIKDPEITVSELVASKIAIIRENITIARFARFKVGE